MMFLMAVTCFTIESYEMSWPARDWPWMTPLSTLGRKPFGMPMKSQMLVPRSAKASIRVEKRWRSTNVRERS